MLDLQVKRRLERMQTPSLHVGVPDDLSMRLRGCEELLCGRDSLADWSSWRHKTCAHRRPAVRRPAPAQTATAASGLPPSGLTPQQRHRCPPRPPRPLCPRAPRHRCRPPLRLLQQRPRWRRHRRHPPPSSPTPPPRRRRQDQASWAPAPRRRRPRRASAASAPGRETPKGPALTLSLASCRPCDTIHHPMQAASVREDNLSSTLNATHNITAPRSKSSACAPDADKPGEPHRNSSLRRHPPERRRVLRAEGVVRPSDLPHGQRLEPHAGGLPRGVVVRLRGEDVAAVAVEGGGGLVEDVGEPGMAEGSCVS